MFRLHILRLREKKKKKKNGTDSCTIWPFPGRTQVYQGSQGQDIKASRKKSCDWSTKVKILTVLLQRKWRRIRHGSISCRFLMPRALRLNRILSHGENRKQEKINTWVANLEFSLRGQGDISRRAESELNGAGGKGYLFVIVAVSRVRRQYTVKTEKELNEISGTRLRSLNLENEVLFAFPSLASCQ